MLIVVGTLALLTRFTSLELGPRVFLAAALAVVGLGLVAAGLTGGRTARGGLIALGVFLSMALLATSAQPWHRYDGHVGDQTYHPVTAAEVLRTYESGIGNVTVDLTDVELGGAGTAISARVDGGVGNIRVLLPRSADVQLSVDQGIGNVTVFESGSARGGFFPGPGRRPGPVTAGPTSSCAWTPESGMWRCPVADYSEFPTTPTAWQENALQDEARWAQEHGWQEVRPPESPIPAGARVVDPVAIVAGLTFLALAVALLVGAALPEALFRDGGVLWAVPVGAGVVLLVRELRRARERR